MAERVLTPPVNLWGRNWNRKIMGNFISVILDGVWYDDYYTVGNLKIGVCETQFVPIFIPVSQLPR